MQAVRLRGWQREAFEQYQRELVENRRISLWEATPGAGKTTAALQVVLHQLRSRRAKNVLVVVPTSHLKSQWARAAARIGLQMDSEFGGSRRMLTADFHGAVVTYQQFGNREKLFRELASRSVVVLDEVHHAGEGLSWGNALRATLQGAPYVLCLSGTAFRSDSNPIPFVSYDRNGMSLPDFTYSYPRAVQEGVCRPTAFFTYGGDVSWSENDRVLSASFSDDLDGATSARRLRAALDMESGWVQPMLKDAHDMLMSTRIEHPEAGGLVVCADQKHARQMSKLLTMLSGERPTVVLSDDTGASKKIKQFADGSSRWLVACNMVSEGVDIPRLRVGVYGTTIRTKMYFRQFLGRVVRIQQHLRGHQVAYVYLPADPFLRVFAEEIESETRHLLLKPKDGFFDEERADRKARDDRGEKTWTPLSSVNSGVDAVIMHGNQLSIFGGNLPAAEVREVIHKEVELRRENTLTRSETKAMLASDIKRLVGAYHKKSGKPHSAIHTLLNKGQSVGSQTSCTEKQLRERIAMLEELIATGLIRTGKAAQRARAGVGMT